MDDTKAAVCANQDPFECLLNNTESCQPLFDKASAFGFPIPGTIEALRAQCEAGTQAVTKANGDSVVAVSSIDTCRLGITGMLSNRAPGCFDPCKPDICSAVSGVVQTYLHTHDLEATGEAVCANAEPFECLLNNTEACQPLFDQAAAFGFPIPGTVESLQSQCAAEAGSGAFAVQSKDSERPSVAFIDPCHLGFMGMLYMQAPGCFTPCKPSICTAVSDVIQTYLRTRDMNETKDAVCDHQGPFECMLSNAAACTPIFAQAATFGFPIPETTGALDDQCGN